MIADIPKVLCQSVSCNIDKQHCRVSHRHYNTVHQYIPRRTRKRIQECAGQYDIARDPGYLLKH